MAQVLRFLNEENSFLGPQCNYLPMIENMRFLAHRQIFQASSKAHFPGLLAYALTLLQEVRLHATW